jgi:hypothetical protein
MHKIHIYTYAYVHMYTYAYIHIHMQLRGDARMFTYPCTHAAQGSTAERADTDYMYVYV